MEPISKMDTDKPASKPARFESKVLTRDDCVAAIRAGVLPRPLIFTNGVFDILHRGHVTYLDRAAQLGASLIVALNTDESVRRLGKGEDRPLNCLADRAALIAALSCVGMVTSFEEDTPQALIEQLRPDVIVKGGDYDMETLPETASVKSWGGRAVAIPFEFQRSTTSLIGKIRR
ncbi:adenylyltransferase/cytidyltransferase family protein [Pollutimonas sp. M17]|uniref:adenylyltransferase/cytidyltransferase family protein n=1 Tax=Pollutimonas sp. M17 TaxID=2962065 RepID=UPI0021F46BA3|nr:adenylyltransferase/cytidyltransferase family protein [Pollutimonas sp. M17]UYO93387.1 adenylyltransferase/cytidyltransferase family protein [Pollutimonas sp. M17]HWK71819.1 adenylyltransferase/cytidyltransferase family protein [Burkholderiaceae bacterium]